MSPDILPPILPAFRVPHLGPAMLAGSGVDEIRQALPSAIIEALEGLAAQIRLQVIEPLLASKDEQQFAENFYRLYPKFRDYYFSSILMMWAAVEEDPDRFAALTIRSVEASYDLIWKQGSRWLGQDAASAAILGITTISQIAKAAARLATPEAAAALQPSEGIESWTNWIVAYLMAAFGILSALRTQDVRPAEARNVVVLAYWSKEYAAKAYHLSKSMGFLRRLPPAAPITEACAEDTVLAEEGIDDYIRLLGKEDRP